nr:MAG TPA: hypothetical protein [Caudoviricetes sp.]
MNHYKTIAGRVYLPAVFKVKRNMFNFVLHFVLHRVAFYILLWQICHFISK